MSAPPYMKLYVADYLGDTHALSVVEHGAYLLLLMAMWRAGGKLPADDAKLAKIARCTPEQWTEVRETVLAFFRRRGGQIAHKRLTAEMAKYETVSAKRREASDKGVSAKRQKNNDVAQPNGSSGVDQLVAKPEPEPEPEKESKPIGLEPRKRGTRISENWAPGEVGTAYAVEKGFTPIETRLMAERFRNYWLAKSGKDATKVDWPATWRTWVLNELQRKPTPLKTGTGGKVDWI